MPDLPQEFIKVSQSRGLISMTTDKQVSDLSLMLYYIFYIILYQNYTWLLFYNNTPFKKLSLPFMFGEIVTPVYEDNRL